MNDFRDCVRISSNGEKELSCSNKIACSASVSVTFRKEFSGRTKIGSRAVFAFATIFARPKKKKRVSHQKPTKTLAGYNRENWDEIFFYDRAKIGASIIRSRRFPFFPSRNREITGSYRRDLYR